MAKKQRRQKPQESRQEQAGLAEKTGLNLKEMLSENALGKLKQLEQTMKKEQERALQAAAEQKKREQEERERNKSFAELLEDYEKKGGGKYS
ncbi:YqkE family protein [Brevibacillus composti]|uniref:YqkE family protein n=1 Tax=Brevibacillus composti TaxID=2796470 RepID=A0A7T5EJR8_9BACL|nr:YqkE family protein [Brevibacillus composti]QQE73884.1 YqkE family protein [Brevibacillus composti]QUO40969.1 YqkE family protein [Brevibacillus composti]